MSALETYARMSGALLSASELAVLDLERIAKDTPHGDRLQYAISLLRRGLSTSNALLNEQVPGLNLVGEAA
jgi:hypothetical protein